MKPFKVRKKGKTRGRPSTEELIVEHIAAHYFYQHIDEIRNAYIDSLVHGTHFLKPSWKGKK